MMHQKLNDITGMDLPAISFGKEIFSDTEGDGAALLNLSNVNREEFMGYANRLWEAGFTKWDFHKLADNDFYTYTKGSDAVYLAYYPAISEMRIVAEKESAYLTFKDTPKEGQYPTLLTQLDLQDFGLSNVMRLADGRMIIMDGGWHFEPDAENLMQVLKEQSPYETPVIAAWIMTHPHLDHYHCFFPFMEKYEGQVVIENILYNFPEFRENVEEKIPEFIRDKEVPYLEKFDEHARRVAKVYKPHTGQVYDFANAHIEMLSTPDDTLYPAMMDTNPLSLMFKMTIEGQTILFTGDGYMKHSKLVERYGDYLKSDIFQIPHHGFNGGSIEADRVIDPTVCLLPSFEHDCYWYINYYNDHCKTLMTDLNVQAFITGGKNETIELPYTPGPASRRLMLDKLAEARKALGSKSWFFVDYSMEESKFIIVSRGHAKKVFANLIFEDGKKNVSFIKINLKGGMTRIDFTNPEDIDGDALFFNHGALAKKGVEPGSRFAIHFQSDEPVVIVGPRPADYHN